MKKQELIHLHGLLAQVQNHYEMQTGDDVDVTDYDEIGVKPTSIHKSKTDHKEAVFSLSKCLTADITSKESTKTPAAAD